MEITKTPETVAKQIAEKLGFGGGVVLLTMEKLPLPFPRQPMIRFIAWNGNTEKEKICN